jgi:hypothetical protein
MRRVTLLCGLVCLLLQSAPDARCSLYDPVRRAKPACSECVIVVYVMYVMRVCCDGVVRAVSIEQRLLHESHVQCLDAQRSVQRD